MLNSLFFLLPNARQLKCIKKQVWLVIIYVGGGGSGTVEEEKNTGACSKLRPLCVIDFNFQGGLLF